MNLLVVRFSALGDVAMTVPVIDSLARQYPQLTITVLSRERMRPLFAYVPSNVRFYGVDLKQYSGLGGIWKMFKRLKGEQYDAVADLHGVLRSRVLCFFFRLMGISVACIDKGRCAKRIITRFRYKRLTPLPSTFQRYEAVLAQLDYPVQTYFHSIWGNRKGDSTLFGSVVGMLDSCPWVGIAPFAAHRGKVLPEVTTKALICALSTRQECRIFLFGAGKEEEEKLGQWETISPNVTSLAGKLSLEAELSLMSHLKVMVCMDSGNMHLASLVGTPVVSIWGATHPNAGFMGWGQKMQNVVQTALPCRPCSIYGNKTCRRGDYACLAEIKVDEIMEKIKNYLK